MKGILERADLGPGTWVLVADDGQRYQLTGDVPARLEGRRVEVDGRVVASFGIFMAGPTIEVRRVRAAG